MHDEALTQHACALFPKLPRFQNFYLAGGTALALQIGHRVSIDFDLFSLEDVPTQSIDFLRRSVSRKEIQKFLKEAVENYTRSLY